MDTAGSRPQAGGGSSHDGNSPRDGDSPHDGNSPRDGDSPRDAGSLRDGPVLPDIVIAPAHPAPHEPTEIVFEVRPGEAGTEVLPVFSSVRRLVAEFGPAQPWLALPLRTVRELAAAGGIREVVLDPVVPAGAWRWQYSDLEMLQQSLG